MDIYHFVHCRCRAFTGGDNLIGQDGLSGISETYDRLWDNGTLAACGMALSRPDASRSRLTYYDTALSGIVYILIDPIYYILGIIVGHISIAFVVYFFGIAALLLSVLISFALKKSIIARIFFTSSDYNSSMISPDQ